MMRILARRIGLLPAMAAACAFATQAAGATFKTVAREPRFVWTAEGEFVPQPFPVSYRYLGGEHRRIELILSRDRFHLDGVDPDRVLAPRDDSLEQGRGAVQFFRVLYEDLPDIEMYALETSAGAVNARHHYFLREGGDRFHHLGHFANLAYDPARQVFEGAERFGPRDYGSSAYRLHEDGGSLLVKVAGATGGKGWACSQEYDAAGTIQGECLARGRFVASGEETELRVGIGGYGLRSHVVLELNDVAGRRVSVLCDEGYAEGESCPVSEEGEARLRPYGFSWEFGYPVDLPGICRDPVSGRDHLVFRGHTGGSKASMHYLVFSFDPESRDLRLEHVRSRSSYATGPAIGFVESGTCNWRQSKDAEAAIGEAMSRLLVHGRREEPEQSYSWEMPVREVPDRVARDMLLALTEGATWSFVTLQGARYSSAQDHDAWRVIQVQKQGGYCEETPGVVLVQDRRRDRWWSIYDTRFDCRRMYALEDMVVSDDSLFARMCRTCQWDANPDLMDVVTVDLSSLGDGDGKSVPVSRVDRDETPALFGDATRNHLRHDVMRAEIRGQGK